MASPDAGDYTLRLTYVFKRPNDGNTMVRQVTSDGLSNNGTNILFDFYTTYYEDAGNGDYQFTHFTFGSYFAVNSETGAVSQQRTEDEDGM